MSGPQCVGPSASGEAAAASVAPPPQTVEATAQAIRAQNTTIPRTGVNAGRQVLDAAGAAADIEAIRASDGPRADAIQRALSDGLPLSGRSTFDQAVSRVRAETAANAPGTFSASLAPNRREGVDGMFVEGGAKAGVADGTASAEARLGLGGARLDGVGTLDITNDTVGGAGQLSVYAAQAQGQGHVAWTGASARGDAKAAMAEADASVFVGSQSNPYAEGGAKGAILSAETKGQALLGHTADRSGVAVGASAKAAVLTGAIDGEINIPLPFTDNTFRVAVEVGGDLVAAGVGGAAGAYHDHQTGRSHLGVMGEVAVFLGLKADVDLSFGPAYTSRER